MEENGSIRDWLPCERATNVETEPKRLWDGVSGDIMYPWWKRGLRSLVNCERAAAWWWLG